MRGALLLTTTLVQALVHGQNSVVINEIQTANQGTITLPTGGTPDWIELYNPTNSVVRLTGMRIAINGRQHLIDAPLKIAAKGYQLLLCDGHPERGGDHVGFTLPRTGGALLLIAADGISITDLFTFPAIPANNSMGRLPDGHKRWSFLEQPTPGAANRSAEMVEVRTRAPEPRFDPATGHFDQAFELRIETREGDVVRFTLDGSEPGLESGLSYTDPIRIKTTTTIRAKTYRTGSLPSDEYCASYFVGERTGTGLALTMDHADLWNDSTGINIDGVFANHSRSGAGWERPGIMQWPGAEAIPVGVRISGSGSRGLAKRSFKLYTRDRYDSPAEGFRFGDGTHSEEGMLRADASPNAFLRNAFMETTVRRYDLQVAAQPSAVVPVFLNASYWGLYRWMPSKDAQWLQQLCGAEAVDVLEGPAGVVRSGKDAHFRAAQKLLFTGAPIDSIDAMIDTRSLIDLACLDLFTGRADHDLNVRCYRPRQAGGRWRWVLFDMDLWAPATDNSLERMCSAAVPETPFLPQLLSHPVLQERLLARLSALLATALDTERSRALADSLFNAHRDQLQADHVRWQNELTHPDPRTSALELAQFLGARPRHVLEQVSERTGRKIKNVIIDVPTPDQGQVLLEGLPLLPGKRSVHCFAGVRMHVEAIPATGHDLAGWRGTDGDGHHQLIDPSRVGRVAPRFVRVLP